MSAIVSFGSAGMGTVRFSAIDQTLASVSMIPAAVCSYQKLPTDPVGMHSLTLENVVVGSRVAIRDQSNTTTLYDQIAGASTVVIPLSVYSGGSALNNWRIKVRKASGGTTYIPYETLMTAAPGSSTIYVSQIPDE